MKLLKSLRCWLGLDCEWTQWKKMTARYSRTCTAMDGNAFIQGEKRIQFTQFWQERNCTLCGKIQQEDLEH